MLTNKASVMLFMKGNKQEAKCGFSKQILEILNSTGVEYETFDILEDKEVRQGLKTFSNWPTYPQLYVRGDLVGGLDIVKVRAFHRYSQELKCVMFKHPASVVWAPLFYGLTPSLVHGCVTSHASSCSEPS